MKETITTEQLADMLQTGMTKAQEKMREIKSVSDILQISGMCHKKDYEYWVQLRLGKVKEQKDHAN
ncbi:MAG TPA: hypothetical protein GX745_01920 [Clostridiales bacterium]|nr:hypothetical protein [Clostridiales bacterium]